MFFVFSLNNSAISAQQKSGETSLLDKLVMKRDLTGAWKINLGESDDVLKKIQSVAKNRAIAENIGTNNSSPSISVSLFRRID